MRLLSLRARIFTALIFLVVVASFLIAGVTIYQYREQSNTYNEQRLERKEGQLKKRLFYLLDRSKVDVVPNNVPLIFKEYMQETADFLNINFRIYTLEGEKILSTQLMETLPNQTLSKEVLQQLRFNTYDHYIDVSSSDGIRMRSSFSYILDSNDAPLAILNVPYFDDDSLNSMELNAFLLRLVQVYVVMLIIAIILAFFVSSYVTKSLEAISNKLNETKLTKTNAKIELNKASREISTLVNAYNHMVDELEQSAVKLAKSQREAAWREMAKQVAHEIKNPLTPMRLSIQHFEQQFAKGGTQSREQVHEFSQSLIQQIDTMSAIASAFSQFAAMPTGNAKRLNINSSVQRAMDLYKDKFILLYSNEESLYSQLDETQLVRVVNNLISNALQATAKMDTPKIEVRLRGDSDWVYIEVQDNGEGIPEELLNHIFEPKFTTKTGGMGLGLSMVKSIVETYGGSVTFDSTQGVSTCFEVRFPRIS